MGFHQKGKYPNNWDSKGGEEKRGQRVCLKKQQLRDFPGGPVVRTPRFQCKACGLAPGQGIEISHATWGSQKMLNDDGVMKWME